MLRMFFRIITYAKYVLFSRHGRGHGIHSPFVFDLVTAVFRNKTEDHVVINIKKATKRLKCDRRIISVSDPGAGSVRMKESLRKVSDIARYSAVPEKYGILLYKLAGEFGRNGILELGTSLGISTMYLAAGSGRGIVYTIEGSAETAGIAGENFEIEGFGNIRLLTGLFDDRLHEIEAMGVRPGLVFIDGDHRREKLLGNFERIACISDPETVVVIDDIYYSEEMHEAWKLIKKDRRVSATIDIYRMGLVFFREGITHNDYIIRY